MNIVLGIDPGSKHLGFGVLRENEGQVQWVDHGVVSIPQKLTFPQKLDYLRGKLMALYEQYQPKYLALERAFFGKSADSAFKLGLVRGVCLQLAAEKDNDIFEYAPKHIKKYVTGNGNATKEQVQTMVFSSLNLRGSTELDASDALAIAYVGASELEVKKRLKQLEL